MKKRALAMAAVLWVASGASLMAGERKPSRGDAPRRLGEALRSGTADVETIATIVRWVLEEKEENVAPGLATALHAALDGVDQLGNDPEWEAAARGAIDLFVGLLDDARAHRRRDEASLSRDLGPLVDAAAPAVAATLREVDAPTREALRRAWELLAPASPCGPPR
jgi:hypothetical protein